MRVISGLAGGRRLFSVKGLNTRPTADKVKTALFNILGSLVIDSVVLDLFAGTGALGVEALSRGARKAYFIDLNEAAIKVIQRNLELTGLAASAVVFRNDARRALAILARQGHKLDLIFIDPPYNQGLVEPVLQEIGSRSLLTGNGWIIVETSSKEKLPASIGGLNLNRQENYGDNMLSFYRPEHPTGPADGGRE